MLTPIQVPCSWKKLVQVELLCAAFCFYEKVFCTLEEMTTGTLGYFLALKKTPRLHDVQWLRGLRQHDSTTNTANGELSSATVHQLCSDVEKNHKFPSRSILKQWQGKKRSSSIYSRLTLQRTDIEETPITLPILCSLWNSRCQSRHGRHRGKGDLVDNMCWLYMAFFTPTWPL